jgi:hypothetical protein
MFEIDDNFLTSVGYNVATLTDARKEQYKTEILEELHARVAEELSADLDESQTDDLQGIQASAERAKSWLYEFHSDFESADEYKSLVSLLNEDDAQIFYAGLLWLQHAVPGYGERMQEIMQDYQNELIERRRLANDAVGL